MKVLATRNKAKFLLVSVNKRIESLRIHKGKIIMYNEVGDANFKLGFQFDLKQNYSKAIEYYTMAAMSGHEKAQFRLGMMYFEGIGVDQDYEEAINLFTLAAKQNHTNAQFYLGVAGVAGSIDWLKIAANKNHTEAQFFLGNAYEEGRGVTKNYLLAVKWWAKAANNGHEKARQKIIVNDIAESFYSKDPISIRYDI